MMQLKIKVFAVVQFLKVYIDILLLHFPPSPLLYELIRNKLQNHVIKFHFVSLRFRFTLSYKNVNSDPQTRI